MRDSQKSARKNIMNPEFKGTFFVFSSFTCWSLHRTDHSHGLGQQQLGRTHHGVVGHVGEHVKDCHHHHGADNRERDGAEKMP